MAGGFDSGPDDIITQINVVPLVDIILVVLIIFMVTTTLIANQGIEVDLPEAATGEGTAPSTLGLTLRATGELFLNGVATSMEQLPQQLRDQAAADPKVQAIIAADQAVSHGKVIALIDLIRKNGVTRFALNVDPVPADTR